MMCQYLPELSHVLNAETSWPTERVINIYTLQQLSSHNYMSGRLLSLHFVSLTASKKLLALSLFPR